MFRKPSCRIFSLLLLIAALTLSGCGPLIRSVIEPVRTSGTAPTPVESFGMGQLYQSDSLGFSLYLPDTYQFSEANANEVMVLAPGEGHPSDDRAGLFIFVEPASGRTAEQVAKQTADEAKAQMGAGYTGGTINNLKIDGEPAYSVSELPGQDFNRQLFVVHNDRLYKLMFVPDNPRASAYRLMEGVYTIVIGNFHFMK